MRKICSVLMTLLIVLSVLGACTTLSGAAAPVPAEVDAAPQPVANLPSPMTNYASLQAMLAATPGINMKDAPAGATNVSYDTITGGDVSPIAQIIFQYEGHDYTYRAAVCLTESAMKDIAGVYDQFSAHKDVVTDANLTAGGTYSLDYSDGTTLGLATWYYAPTQCQYSLFTTTGSGPDQQIEEIVDYLLPITTAVDGTPLMLPQTTMTPDSFNAVGTVEGTVVSLGDNAIIINMDNGNTLSFVLSNIVTVDVMPGDQVSIDYSGDILDTPEAVTVTVTAKVAAQISGVVTQHDAKMVYVKTATGNVFAFLLTDKTLVSGKATVITTNAEVKVTYTGDILTHPVVTAIEIVKAGSDNDPLVNKTLDGRVTQLTTKTVYIHTNSGHTYKFQRVSSTEYLGKYPLEVGAKIRVTYDGYASKAPDAKIINVLAPPDPTPPGPKTYKATGYIEAMDGNMISILGDDGKEYGFLLGKVKITGDSDCGVGDRATVTYYLEHDGTKTATTIFFKKTLLK